MLKNRKVVKDILPWIPEKQIIILNGPRQVGKTSILKLLETEIKAKSPENTVFYFNLEEIKVLESLNTDPDNIISYVTNHDSRNYFLLDEIQYLDNPSNFLKHIYDKYGESIKIIATGSSNLEIKAKLQDSLAGRTVSFKILPLNFEEFLIFKNFQYTEYLDKPKIPPDIMAHFDSALTEYLTYGGMPDIVLQPNPDKKEILLQAYVNAYINKDARMIGKIDNIQGFNNLTKLLASGIGNLVNISELSNSLNLSRRDIDSFLSILMHTYIIDFIYPYKSNIRASITKMPKTYFFDVGIRNTILGNFLDINTREDNGRLFENFIYCELKTLKPSEINFFRTLSGSEIDFIIQDKSRIYAIEAKYKRLKSSINQRMLQSFSAENKTKAIIPGIVNLQLNKTVKDVKYFDWRLLTDFLKEKIA